MFKILLGVVLTAILLVSAFIYFSRPETSPSSAAPAPQLTFIPPSGNTPPPATALDVSKIYSALLNTTAGPMTIELTASATPKTVENFITLSRKGFYANTIFHRVIAGFMIQGGDPKGNGSGGPGYTFADEPFTGEYTRGTVAMANSGPNTNGSQFFIMHADQSLPKNYVIFGHLVSGFDTLDKIATASTRANVNMPGENSIPIDPVKILSITIEEK